MHNGKYVLAQLLDFIDKDVFLRISNKYNGNRYVKDFTCWNQLAVMVFGQLSNRESLRDVVFAAQALEDKASVSASESMCPEALLRMRITSGITTSLNSLHITP